MISTMLSTACCIHMLEMFVKYLNIVQKQFLQTYLLKEEKQQSCVGVVVGAKIEDNVKGN